MDFQRGRCRKQVNVWPGTPLNWDESLETQLTGNNQIAISADDDQLGLDEHFDLILTDMQFDPNNPMVRFAIGVGGAFMTINGMNWIRLLHTGALPGQPPSCYYDWISDVTPPCMNQSGLEQKQRLQQVLFPKGVMYSDGIYRTSATSPISIC